MGKRLPNCLARKFGWKRGKDKRGKPKRVEGHSTEQKAAKKEGDSFHKVSPSRKSEKIQYRYYDRSDCLDPYKIKILLSATPIK